MGRRSRTRAQRAGTPASARPARPARPAPVAKPSGRRGLAGLDPLRRTLVSYLVGAMLVAVATLAGIVVLGGTLGPFIVLAVVLVAAGLIHRAARARLVGAEMGDEDRVIQTLAGGMLLICVLLAAASAVVSVVS